MQVLPGLQFVIVPLLAEHHVLPHLRVNPAGPQACSLKRDFYSQNQEMSLKEEEELLCT